LANGGVYATAAGTLFVLKVQDNKISIKYSLPYGEILMYELIQLRDEGIYSGY
jgi:hypothetical protein